MVWSSRVEARRQVSGNDGATTRDDFSHALQQNVWEIKLRRQTEKKKYGRREGSSPPAGRSSLSPPVTAGRRARRCRVRPRSIRSGSRFGYRGWRIDIDPRTVVDRYREVCRRRWIGAANDRESTGQSRHARANGRTHRHNVTRPVTRTWYSLSW